MFGFELGMTVQLKTGGSVLHIAKVQGCDVTLIAADNSTKTVTPGELVDCYKVTKVEQDIVHRSKQFLKLEEHTEARLEYMRSQARLVLFQTFRLYQPSVSVDLKLTAGRDRHVFAADKYQAGTLKLVPYSWYISGVAIEGQEKPHSQPHIRLKLRIKGIAYIVTITAASAPKPTKSSKPLAKELIVPYWLVRSTSDKEKANMHHSTMMCTMMCTIPQCESAEETVMVPTLVNTKVLQEGDELFRKNRALWYEHVTGDSLIGLSLADQRGRASSGRAGIFRAYTDGRSTRG